MLAFRVAWEILQGELSHISRVRYLDLASTEAPLEGICFFPEVCFKRTWLLILDNWHARPEYQSALDKLINDRWGAGASVLYCLTRFTTDDSAMAMPSLTGIPDGELPLMDTVASTVEVSRGMINQRALGFQSPGQWTHVTPLALVPLATDGRRLVEEEDYEQALTAPSIHKKIRGNLRFLRWRLASWNPPEKRLRDVTVEDVLRSFDQELIQPNRQFPGTIERIAAVAQWELPYHRGLGMAEGNRTTAGRLYP